MSFRNTFTSFAMIVIFACSYVSAAQADLETRLRAVIHDVPTKKVPGIVLLIDGPEGSTLHLRGFANRKTKSPLSADHLIRAGSIGKTYVAALAVIAASEGLLDLDAPIDCYLDPEVVQNLPMKKLPTVRQVLNHTSGIPDFVTAKFYFTWKKTSPPTSHQVFRAIQGKPATNAPGAAVHYSNTNYYIAALVLERVYGQTLESLLEDKLFNPHGLQATYYNQHRPPGDEIHGYGSELRKWKDTYEWRENYGPDGGIKATPADLARWIRILFAPGGELSEIGATMTQAPVKEGERKFQGLGVDIRVSRNGTEVYGHTGALWGYLSAAFYLPEHDIVLVLYMNRSDRKVFQSTLSEILRAIVEATTN